MEGCIGGRYSCAWYSGCGMETATLLTQLRSISSSSEGSNFLFFGSRTGACVGGWAGGCVEPLLAVPGLVGLAIVMLEVG